jgi:hypothetical protein
MSFFVQPTAAPRPRTKNIRSVSLFFAGLLILMVVAQLFTFEDFPEVITHMQFPGGELFSPVRAAFIAVLEIAALPFLLSMHLSPLARAVSMFAGWAVAAAWLVASLWMNIVLENTINSGFLGATLSITSGWWTVFFSLALVVLAVWTSWGMWPFKRKN